MTSAIPSTGSAGRWGPLWGARGVDWSVVEEQQVPTYAEAIRRAGIAPGDRVLEVGCGSGVFLREVVDRGAHAVGLDASAAMIELARARVPAAELHLGDLQFLPFRDDAFDAVAGFNAFFFAADMVAALREAGRVARAGAPVVIQVWGDPGRCDLTAMKRALAPFFPPPDPGTPPAPALWEPGVLEDLADAAGLTPVDAFDVSWPYDFPDENALARAMLAPGNVVEVLRAAEEELVRRTIVDALVRYRRADGSYRLENTWHTLIACA